MDAPLAQFSRSETLTALATAKTPKKFPDGEFELRTFFFFCMLTSSLASIFEAPTYEWLKGIGLFFDSLVGYHWFCDD